MTFLRNAWAVMGPEGFVLQLPGLGKPARVPKLSSLHPERRTIMHFTPTSQVKKMGLLSSRDGALGGHVGSRADASRRDLFSPPP